MFFSIAFLIYGLINFYLFLRGWETIPPTSNLKQLYLVVFLSLSLSFIAGRFLERVMLNWLSSTLVWIGSFWLAAMSYFVLVLLTIDLLRLINYLLPILPDALGRALDGGGETLGIAVVGFVVLVVIGGTINAFHPRIKRLDLNISKNSHPLKDLNIVVASDIHLGTIVCRARLERIVGEINRLDPDIVLLPGDVVDEDLAPVIKQNLGETLRKIKSRYGVIAITGNHEYIGGVEEAVNYLVDHGITVLRDSSIRIAESIYVVGREDVSIKQFTGKKRKPLNEILTGVNGNLPIVLMDHQPLRLDDAASNGIDLQLSGHTHHGQLWPFNFITKAVYEISWGYKKKGDTHIYVSCGVGTWGPPVRTGNRPEIVNIRLSFS